MDTVEIAVVGAGPAGVAAAAAAARLGARVALIDESPRPGGQFFRQPARSPSGAASEHLRQHYARGRQLLDELDQPNIGLYPNTIAWNLTPQRALYLSGPGAPPALQAQRVILAPGATERSVAFPGWTLPGVMTVGAVQGLLKSQGLIPAGPVLLAGSGPLLLAVARQLVDAGAQVAGVVEASGQLRWMRYLARFRRHRERLWEGLSHWQRLIEAGVALQFGRAVTRAVARPDGAGVAAVEIAPVDEQWRPDPRSARQLPAEIVAVSFGFIPATELARLAGCVHAFDPAVGAWVTRTDDRLETSVAGIYAVGELRGIGGAEAALAEGRLAGLAAAASLGYRPADLEARLAEARAQQKEQRAFAAVMTDLFAVQPGLALFATDDTVVCRCEGVTAGELRAAARAGATQLNALKAWNRCGMGLCQGRVCGPIAAGVVAAAAGTRLESAGVFTARAPVKPVPLGVVGRTAAARPSAPALEDHVGYGRAILR